MSDPTEALRRHCTALPPGPVADVPALERLLAAAWDALAGDDGGMEAHKLLNRMEAVAWDSPVLSFVIERHGGTVMGSTRAELQHWQVDVEKKTATLVKSGHRQLKSMASRLSVKQMAEEIVVSILNDEDDDWLMRLNDGTVKILVSKIFPTGSGFKRTVGGRRKRLLQYVGAKLAENGWLEVGTGQFRRSADFQSEHDHP